MKRFVKLLLLMVLVVPIGLNAQKKDYSGEKGYVSFSDLSKYESGQRYTEIILEDNLLRLAAKFAKNEDPALAEMISGLKLIQVFQVEVNRDNSKELEQRVVKMSDNLMNKNWERIVRIKDRDENVSVLINLDMEANIDGLVVVAFDDDQEATFVNIVGKIDIETIGRLSDKWDIPHLDKIKSN